MVNPCEIYAALSLYHSVSGRILVSYLSAPERAALCGRAGLPADEWDQINTLPELEKACRKIRRAGVSVMENTIEEIISFAVPVFLPSGRIMSLGLTMPRMRCRTADRTRIIRLLKEHAASLSR